MNTCKHDFIKNKNEKITIEQVTDKIRSTWNIPQQFEFTALVFAKCKKCGEPRAYRVSGTTFKKCEELANTLLI